MTLSLAEAEMFYRVTISRFDVAEEKAGEFEAVSDEIALVIFKERFKNDKDYSWERLKLVRIDQVEKVTNIEYSSPDDRAREGSEQKIV